MNLTFSDKLGVFFTAIIIVPYMTYLIVRWGTHGYYVSKRMWERSREDDNEKE